MQKLQTAQLTYLGAVIDESLRLYPPVPIDVRCTNKDDVLPSGYGTFPSPSLPVFPYLSFLRPSPYTFLLFFSFFVALPAGTKVVYSAFSTHRLAQYWDRPEEFRPERWEEDEIKVKREKKEREERERGRK